jgi:hypothetical protein
MPCLLAIIALAAPRLMLVLTVLFSDYIGRAYETTLLPLLGFFFLPTTTLAYAWAINSRGEVSGLGLVVVVVAVLIDLGTFQGARTGRGQRAD